MMGIQDYLKAYLCERPLFLSLIRAKEVFLFQKYLPMKPPILDIGCGDGFFANVTFAKNFQFPSANWRTNFQLDVGLDLQNSRINEARKLGIYKKLVIYDGVKIPFPDNYFSTIVSNCVLEHVTHLDSVIGEAYRVLKPGGVFLTTVMAKPWEDNLFGAKILDDFYKKWMRKKQIHINLFTKRAWDKIFQDAGFKITNRVGYLSPSACQLIDISHYLSVPSLVIYKLLGKWVMFPGLFTRICPVKYFTKVISKEIKANKSGAIFYQLAKSPKENISL